jgi:hypothetical protein
MSAVGHSGVLALCIAALMTLLPDKPRQNSMLEGIPSGKTRVLDLSYAINDKLVPWPGDEKFFEAKVNATIEKNGYLRGADARTLRHASDAHTLRWKTAGTRFLRSN